eukprot:CAMPEP_0179915580 /NCGR_PEP_ID=MMETSP0983-20121128/1752_1 /TAXON_ID=483367 /ORGANISM="non described non described, Strain CCMP 2436" /LENGTH=50 /DNA_ID=CAMNT_0021818011 /DNA_START=79 /DNA_END=228 /DNA_ORIENTATION=-
MAAWRLSGRGRAVAERGQLRRVRGQLHRSASLTSSRNRRQLSAVHEARVP